MLTALLALPDRIVLVDPLTGTARSANLPDRPTCAAADPSRPHRAWCGTRRGGVYRSDDGGLTWEHAGLPDQHVTAVAVSPGGGIVWAGTEPSELWRSDDEGRGWHRLEAMEALPSSSDWSFPPKPDTHHVRWIACHPTDATRLWVALEAGALVSTGDGGHTWRDRVAGGPYDTHELAVHPMAPDALHSAAGDGYYTSYDGGLTWSQPDEGMDVGYLRSVALPPDRPDVVIVTAASSPRTAYGAGRSDGRLYRREGAETWQRVTHGWPAEPTTIAPLLAAGRAEGELWAADERGLHRSDDSGLRWSQVHGWDRTPDHLRALVLLGG